MTNVFDDQLCQRQPLATSLLDAALQNRRIANAYVLTGRDVDDKWSLVRQLACFLNCIKRKDDIESCVVNSPDADLEKLCQNCRWLWRNEHPQALIALDASETKSGKISVEKARLLAEEVSKTSQFHRVIVVPDASQEIFHRPAANALLKTIEEPKAGCVFFLFATDVEDVLPTVVSRAHVIPLRNRMELFRKNDLMSEFRSTYLQIRKDLSSLPSALASIKQLCDVVNESDLDAESIGQMIDVAVLVEGDLLKEKSISQKHCAQYMLRLIDLADVHRQQADHYVSKKAVIESFILSWRKLSMQLNPETSYS
jgi:hypothetical protein